MDKKIFPGGTTADMRAEELRKKQEQKKEAQRQKQESREFHKKIDAQNKQRKKEERQKFLKNIGPATRLLIVRRSLATFAAAVAVEIGLGSIFWLVNNAEFSAGAKPQEHRREYLASLKNAYNVTNLFDGDKWKRIEHDHASDAIETLVAILLLGVAAGLARNRYKKDVDVAKQTLDVTTKHTMSALYRIKTDSEYASYLRWRLHPVSRAVIQNMSSMDPVWFNALLNDEISDPSRDYVMTVIRGYLETHPDDFKKVLDVYNAETLPKSLKRKYAAHTR